MSTEIKNQPFNVPVGGEWWLPGDTEAVRYGTFYPETFELDLLHGWPYEANPDKNIAIRDRNIDVIHGKVITEDKMLEVTLFGCVYSSMGLEDQSSNVSGMTQTATVRIKKILIGDHVNEAIDEVSITTDLTERLTNLPNRYFRDPYKPIEDGVVEFKMPKDHDVFKAHQPEYDMRLWFKGVVLTNSASSESIVSSTLIWKAKFASPYGIYDDIFDLPINHLLTFTSVACFERDMIKEIYVYIEDRPLRIFLSPEYSRFVASSDYDKSRTNALFALDADQFEDRYTKLVEDEKLMNFSTRLMSQRGRSAYLEERYGLVTGMIEQIVKAYLHDGYYKIKTSDQSTLPVGQYRKLAAATENAEITKINDAIQKAHLEKGPLLQIFTAIVETNIFQDPEIDVEITARAFNYFRNIVAHGDTISFEDRAIALWLVQLFYWKAYQFVLLQMGVEENEYLDNSMGNHRYERIIANLVSDSAGIQVCSDKLYE